jgi:hypothetical protein
MRNPNIKSLGFIYCLCLLVALFFNACKDPIIVEIDYQCPGAIVYDFSNEISNENKEGKGIVPVPYVCNEVIFEPGTIGDNDSIRAALIDLGFIKKDSCDCSSQLELWYYNEGGDIDINGVVKSPPPSDDGNGVGRLHFNFEIEFPRPRREQGDSGKSGELAKFFPGTPLCNQATDPVRIAIVDTGVDTDPSVSNNSLLSNGWEKASQQTSCPEFPAADYYGLNATNHTNPPIDSNGHGTHVQGILSGISAMEGARNGIPFAFLNTKFTRGATPSGSIFDAVCSMYYAIDEGAQIINCSWGYTGLEINRDSQLLYSVLQLALEKNVLVIASMGNDTSDLSGNRDFWPASYAENFDNVISVGAINSSDADLNLTYFSNRAMGDEMTITAWGLEVPSAYPKAVQAANGTSQTGAALLSGTSMAAPFVSLSAGVIIGLEPGIKAVEVKKIILNSAKSHTGYWVLDHQKAIEGFCDRPR